MSVVNELIRELREIANCYYGEIKNYVSTIEEAADIIESLSAKLQAANMERSEDCGGWIPCSERFPEKDTDVLIRYYNSKEGKFLTDIAWIDEEGEWQLTREKAGYFPPNFKKEMEKWMPLPGE